MTCINKALKICTSIASKEMSMLSKQMSRISVAGFTTAKTNGKSIASASASSVTGKSYSSMKQVTPAKTAKKAPVSIQKELTEIIASEKDFELKATPYANELRANLKCSDSSASAVTELLPEELAEQLKETGFTLERAVLGESVVILRKETANEVIRLELDIEQIYRNEDLFMEQDNEYMDEMIEEQEMEDAKDLESTSSGKGKSAVNASKKTSASDLDAEMDEDLEDDMDEDFEDNTFLEVGMEVTSKANATSSDAKPLSFRAQLILRDGGEECEISALSFGPATPADSAAVEGNSQVNGNLYNGPSVEDLDEVLQDALVRYVQSRGVNAELYGFLAEYSEFKESLEYLNWLNNAKKFFSSTA